MDNELEARLRRLEVGLAGQRELVERQAARDAEQHERTQALLRELMSLMTQPEPEGPSLQVLLAAVLEQLRLGQETAQQTLAALERLGRGGLDQGRHGLSGRADA